MILRTNYRNQDMKPRRSTTLVTVIALAAICLFVWVSIALKQTAVELDDTESNSDNSTDLEEEERLLRKRLLLGAPGDILFATAALGRPPYSMSPQYLWSKIVSRRDEEYPGRYFLDGWVELIHREPGIGAMTVLVAIDVILPAVDDRSSLGAIAATLDGLEAKLPELKEVTIESRRSVRTRLNNIVGPPSSELMNIPVIDAEQALGFTPAWVRIPSGEFMMGCTPESEDNCPDIASPRHIRQVNSFWILSHEITTEQYCFFDPNCIPSQISLQAVSRVSWFEAYAFAAWIGGRLPTEAEWEYAVRFPLSDNTRAMPHETQPTNIESYAWTDEEYPSQPHAVGRKLSNRSGLYDVYGNVWEWCADVLEPYPRQGNTVPSGEHEVRQRQRVLRGGSIWFSSADATAVNRIASWPEYRSIDYGFRPVLPQ